MAHLLSWSPCPVRGMLFVLGVVAMSGQAASTNPSADRYMFVENTDRWVGVIRGEWKLVGKLDKNGDFVHEYKLKAGEGVFGRFPAYVLLNGRGPTPWKAYEFRSGMLIPGEMQKDGHFAPEAGGKIIPFEDYKYSPDAPPIWNLPGRFVTEEEAAKLKRLKPADKK